MYTYIYIYRYYTYYNHSIVVSFNAEFMLVRQVLFILPYQVVGLIQKGIHIAAVPQTDCMVGHQQISASDLPGTSVHIITNSYYIWPVSIPKYMYIKYIQNGHISNVHCFPHINISPYVSPSMSHRYPSATRLHLEKECVLDSDWAYDDQDLPG